MYTDKYNVLLRPIISKHAQALVTRACFPVQLLEEQVGGCTQLQRVRLKHNAVNWPCRLHACACWLFCLLLFLLLPSCLPFGFISRFLAAGCSACAARARDAWTCFMCASTAFLTAAGLVVKTTTASHRCFDSYNLAKFVDCAILQ